MNRRFLPPTIVAATLALILGLLHTVQLTAASMSTAASAIVAVSANDADFTAGPLNQGGFTQASSTAVFALEIQNSGSTPTDTYELELTSGWSATLFGPDGTTPLVDTNGSGDVDTGVVAQGQTFVVNASFDAPGNAAVGAANDALMYIHSTISPSLVMTATFQSAIPAPFAQSLYQQTSRNFNWIMSQPNANFEVQTSPNNWYGESTTYPDIAVAETNMGYFYLWTNLRYISDVWRSELEFRLTDKAGVPVTSIAKLTDLSSVTDETLDSMPAVALTPGGNIGVTWFRQTNKDDGSQLFNVYLAILDPSGQPITDTINLTDNSQWRGPGTLEYDVPAFRSPRIAATEDDHFFVAWERSVLTYTLGVSETIVESDLDDIYYAIYASDGVSVTNAINVTNNVPSETTRSLAPAIDGVNVDRVFLSWAQRRPLEPGGDDILYTVIDSSNATVKSITEMAGDGTLTPVDWSNFDVVELSNGSIVAAWEAYGCPDYEWSPRIRYAIFGGSNYNRIGQPACLPPTVVAAGGDESVSLVADNRGRAIFTWSDRLDSERKQLYYALVRSNGNVLTDPMIFYFNGPTEGRLGTGFHGYASASRIFLDATIDIDPPLGKGTAGNPVSFSIQYGNFGAVTGTDVVVTLTLAPSLTYVSSSAPTPTVDGQSIIWNLADVVPWSEESFDVEVDLNPAAQLLINYPLTATISVAGQEATLSNNSATANLIATNELYLPMLTQP